MGNETKSEIDNMIKSFGGSGSDSTDAPSTSAPSTSAPATSAPATSAPTTNAPSTEAPATEVPDKRDETIAELRGRIEALEKTPSTKAPATEPPKPESQDFIGDLDLDDVVRDKDALNKVLNAVYTKGIADAQKILGEGVLRTIPDIVKTNIEIMTTLKETSDEFYKNNSDLVPFKKVVAAVFEDIAAKNPGKKYNELLKDVGDEARKRLELHKKAIKDEPPRLPSRKGSPPGKPTKPDVSPLDAELQEMNKTLGR